MPTIAVDLDGTLAHWRSGGSTLTGEWIDGADEFLRELLAIPATRWPTQVVVHTCRATWPAGGNWHAVATFLDAGGFEPWLVETVEALGDDGRSLWIPLERAELGGWTRVPLRGHEPGPAAVGIWRGIGKPVASAYVDDRAVVHPEGSGDYSGTLAAVKALL